MMFHLGVSVTVIVNRGDNSPVYLAAKKFIDVPCSARSRDPVTMKWYHKRHPEWASNVKNSTNKMQGHLNYFREAMLTLSPKAADVIDKLSCTKFEHRVHAVQCPTKFSCKAYYHWNSSIMDERELDVYFVVRKSFSLACISPLAFEVHEQFYVTHNQIINYSTIKYYFSFNCN